MQARTLLGQDVADGWPSWMGISDMAHAHATRDRVGAMNKTVALVGGSLLGGLLLLLVLAQLGPTSAPGKKDEPVIDEGLRGLLGTSSSGVDEHEPILIAPDQGLVDQGKVNRLTSGRAVIQIEGEDGQIAQRYTYEHLEPAARGWHLITKPIAYFYASDKELIVLRSDTARALLVQNKPQAGTLEGNVEIALYEVPNARDIESVADLMPSIVCRTSTVEFDDNLNELHAPSRVTGESKEWSFACRGLSLVYSSMDDLIQTLRFEEREYILLRARQAGKAGTAGAEAAVASTARTAGDGQTPVASTGGAKQAGPERVNTASTTTESGRTGDVPTIASEPDAASLASAVFYQLVLSGEVIIERQLSQTERLRIVGTRLAADLAVEKQSLGRLLAGVTDEPAPAWKMPSVASIGRFAAVAGPRRHPTGQTASGLYPPLAMPVVTSVIGLVDVTRDHAVAPVEPAVARQQPGPVAAGSGTGSSSHPEMHDGDILITGDGPLSIRRLTNAPAALQQAGDVWAVLDGHPVTVTLPDGSVSAGQLDYSRANARLRFSPSSRFELSAQVGDLGDLTSTTARLVVDLPEEGRDEATARVEGPGRFASRRDLFAVAATDETSNGPGNGSGSKGGSGTQDVNRHFMPEVFRISWMEGLELRFDVEGSGAGSNDVAQNGKLRSAEFTGRVRADHTDGLVLETERLLAKFEEPEWTPSSKPGESDGTFGSSDVVLVSVHAVKDVKARSPDGALQADDLLIAMRTATDGSPVPATAEASGHVSVTDFENRLTANYLYVQFLDETMVQPVADDGGQVPHSKSVLSGRQLGRDVVHVIATGSLLLEMPDDRMALADRLEAYPLENRAVLTGQSGQRVRLSQNLAQVTAGEVWLFEEVSEDGTVVRLVKIPGPGVGTFVEPAEPAQPGFERVIDVDEQIRLIEQRMGASRHMPDFGNPNDVADAGQTPGDGHDDVRLVRVEWDRNAEYRETEEQGATLTLAGEVKAEYSPRAAEYNTIAAQQLKFELSNPLQLGDRGTERRLRKMTAIGGDDSPALLQGGRYTDGTRSVPVLMVSIWSHIVEYDDIVEKLETSGDGSMLVIDYRSEDEPIAGDEDDPWVQSGRKPVIDLTGRGETRFDWTGSLVLDGGRGKMGVNDDVIVRHRPLDESRVMRLACQQLDAELSSAASVGTDPMQLAGGETLSLALARASRGVTIYAMDRIVSAASMQYDGRRKVIDLDSDDTQLVSILEQGSAFPAEMTSCRWDLVSDTLEVVEGRPIRVPTN